MTQSNSKKSVEMSLLTKVLILALTIITLCSLALGYVSAVDQTANENMLSYNGIQMLLGNTGGKSASALNPMLLLSLVCYVLLMIGVFFRKDNSFMTIACSAVAFAALLMFLFDARFADKREFNFAADSVRPLIGWWVGAIAALAILVIGIVNKGTINAAKRHN